MAQIDEKNDAQNHEAHVVEPDNGHSDVEEETTEVFENVEEGLLDDVSPDTEDIDLVHSRISNIRSLKLERFPKVERICLRQNLIIDIDGFEPVRETLKELDLYDNKISHIKNLSELTALTTLDLSFNKIKHIKNLDKLVNLVELYFVSNRISKIENLDNLTAIENLELGANRIRVIENLDNQVRLTKLWLGKNKITRLENLSPLRNLRVLSIQSNRLTKLEGLEELHNLEELYLSHNAITKIENLDNNVNLRTLDVANNQLTHIENLSHLKKLEEFWANNNLFGSECFEEVKNELGGTSTLETIYLEGNPMQLENRATYRNKVQLALPQVKQIDATFVR